MSLLRLFNVSKVFGRPVKEAGRLIKMKEIQQAVQNVVAGDNNKLVYAVTKKTPAGTRKTSIFLSNIAGSQDLVEVKTHKQIIKNEDQGMIKNIWNRITRKKPTTVQRDYTAVGTVSKSNPKKYHFEQAVTELSLTSSEQKAALKANSQISENLATAKKAVNNLVATEINMLGETPVLSPAHDIISRAANKHLDAALNLNFKILGDAVDASRIDNIIKNSDRLRLKIDNSENGLQVKTFIK